MPRPVNALPRTILLPFDYKVKVKLVPAKECKEENGKLLDGWFDPDSNSIFIKKTLPAARRRYILGHELGHAVLDWIHECLNNGIMKA